MANNNVQENRNNLLTMIGMVEEITRTNNRLYSLLTSVMHNPEVAKIIKSAVGELYDKVSNLKDNSLTLPLTEEEYPELPNTDDMVREGELNVPETSPRQVNVPQRQQRQRVNTKTKRKRPTSKQKTQ